MTFSCSRAARTPARTAQRHVAAECCAPNEASRPSRNLNRLPLRFFPAASSPSTWDRFCQFTIDHPIKPELHAEAGHDPILGFFVDVMKGQRVIKSYCHFHPLFNRARPLLGCLDFLVSEGFFTGDELNDALVYLQDDGPDPSSKVRRVVEIVEQLRSA